eukprot:NODE_3643_length_927_cov_5.140000_g3491_i0.p1 GENE.NODE_3643_length_927_cov_5.140000_g3491_i0~~NODE_3643_length_927_cov_5.140000_g3491_i0.p1  ORF type:complete len:305 (-),score=65.30 NODE_3643_length_927_cov_5.140000_g3491_i0:13-888(-)
MEAAADAQSISQAPQPNEDDFQCPVCLDLVFKPCVNTCGHVFCFWCMFNAMSGVTASKCPLCRTKYAQLPSVCHALHGFLTTAFPATYQRRALEMQQVEANANIRTMAALPHPQTPFQCVRCVRLAVHPCVPGCGHVFCAACLSEVVHSTRKCPLDCQAPLKAMPSVCRAIQQLLPEAQSASITPDASPPPSIVTCKQTHFGVGCDGCGQYPIVGKRFQCQDCPEEIGFDLCEDCHATPSATMTGRFNQTHHPHHHMTEVPPEGFLHEIQRQCPELTMEQILECIEFSNTD